MRPPHRVGCRLTRFISAGTPLVWDSPCQVKGWQFNAKQFFQRQETTAREIRQHLEKEHAVRAITAPKSAPHKFRVGDPVWVLRPRPMGTHRTKTWFGPGEMIRRTGEDTYRIKFGPGQT